MKKKSIPSLIVNIISFGCLLGLWGLIVFAMASIAFNAYYMEDLLIWYENRFGNISFDLTSGLALIIVTLAIVYVLTMQEKFIKKPRRK